MSTGDIWIIGASMTPFGRFADRDLMDLASTAAMDALKDAQITMDQIGVLMPGEPRRNAAFRGHHENIDIPVVTGAKRDQLAVRREGRV